MSLLFRLATLIPGNLPSIGPGYTWDLMHQTGTYHSSGSFVLSLNLGEITRRCGKVMRSEYYHVKEESDLTWPRIRKLSIQLVEEERGGIQRDKANEARAKRGSKFVKTYGEEGKGPWLNLAKDSNDSSTQ